MLVGSIITNKFKSYIDKWTSVTCKWIDNQHGGNELKDPPHHSSRLQALNQKKKEKVLTFE